MQHAVSFDFTPNQPWPASDSYLELGSYYDPNVYGYANPNSDAWGYMCALLEDTSTTQRLEYCLNEWSTWMEPPDVVNTIFYNSTISQIFTNVETNFGPSTTFATQVSGSSNTIFGPGATGVAHVYAAEITAQNLYNAATAVDNLIKAANGGTCPGPVAGQAVCYSTSGSDYELIGLENGNEMTGGSQYLGSWDSISAAIAGNTADDNPSVVVKRLKRSLAMQAMARNEGVAHNPFEAEVSRKKVAARSVTRPPSRAVMRLMQ